VSLRCCRNGKKEREGGIATFPRKQRAKMREPQQITRFRSRPHSGDLLRLSDRRCSRPRFWSTWLGVPLGQQRARPHCSCNKPQVSNATVFVCPSRTSSVACFRSCSSEKRKIRVVAFGVCISSLVRGCHASPVTLYHLQTGHDFHPCELHSGLRVNLIGHCASCICV